MADRDNRRSRIAGFASLPATRLGMLSDSGNRQSQNVEDVTGATILDKILASIPASARGYAGDIAWLYRQGQLRPWRQTAGEHMQEAGNMLPDLDLRRNFAEGGTVDDILSAYSAPVRSWPGEQALDDEARANYAAMHPEAPKKLRPDEAFRGTFLPFRETTQGKHEWAVPGFLMDVADAAKAIQSSSGTSLGPAIRPSQYSPEAFEQILGHGMAGALAGIAGNMPRVLAKPSAGMTELGIFGGRRGAENLAAKGETRPLQALDMLERLEREGKSREEIWAATNEILKDSPYAGAFRGVDKKPRFEIDDSKARAYVTGDYMPLRDALDAPVMDAYPTLWNVPIKRDLSLRKNGMGAVYHDPPNEKIRIAPGRGANSILHEVQHAVQGREGFSRGASGRDADYNKIAGEVEARAVEARRTISPEERRSRPPWLDYDIKPEHQIVRFGDKGPQMSMSDDAWRKISDLDKALSGDAGRAIDEWVGGPFDTRDKGLSGGIMLPERLEKMPREQLDALGTQVRDIPFDNVNWVNWLYDRTKADFVHTPDGAVAMHPDAVHSVRLFSKGLPLPVPREDDRTVEDILNLYTKD